jgi:hypothetical protein
MLPALTGWTVGRAAYVRRHRQHGLPALVCVIFIVV